VAAKGKRGKIEPEPPRALPPYAVEMTATAEQVYRDLYRKCKAAEDAGHRESVHCTTFRMIEEAIKKVIPRDPLNKAYALRGDLSNIFRLRKGRCGILWIASSSQRRICILFISETMRKEGDSNDPYEVFQRLFESGQFDEMLKRFGVRSSGAKRKT